MAHWMSSPSGQRTTEVVRLSVGLKGSKLTSSQASSGWPFSAQARERRMPLAASSVTAKSMASWLPLARLEQSAA